MADCPKCHSNLPNKFFFKSNAALKCPNCAQELYWSKKTGVCSIMPIIGLIILTYVLTKLHVPSLVTISCILIGAVLSLLSLPLFMTVTVHEKKSSSYWHK